jgi:hypothetical protein
LSQQISPQEAIKTPVDDYTASSSLSSRGKLSPSVVPWISAALLLATILIAANFKLINGTAVPRWDGGDFVAPYYVLIADHARAGKLLLWNPWSNAGSPDFADPQFGAFSPVTVSIGAVTGGSEKGFRVYWLILWFMGPLGLILLAWHLGAPAWGALTVAIAFAFSGLYTGHAEHTPILYSISFIPFLIWRLDVALKCRRFRPAVEAGALWGVSALGGYPALTILSGCFVCLWILGRLCCKEDQSSDRSLRACFSANSTLSRSRWIFALLCLSVCFVVGVIILAPSYLGIFTEMIGYSDRVGMPRAVVVESDAFHAGALLTFSSPYLSILKLYGNPKLWEFTDVTMSSIYLAAPLMVLAGLAIVVRPRSSWRWWLSAVALLAIMCAASRHLPVRGWLYDVFFFTRYFRHSALFRIYAMFSLTVLAILVTKDIEDARKQPTAPIWKQFLGTAFFGSVAAVAAYVFVMSGIEQPGIHFSLATFQLCFAWIGTLAVAVLIFLSDNKKYLPFFFLALVIGDSFLTYRLTQPTIYETGPNRTVWDKLNFLHRSSLDLTPNGLMRELRPPAWTFEHVHNKNLPLKLATFENYASLSNRFHQDIAHRPALAAMALGEQRIWFSAEIKMVLPSDSSYAAFVQRSESLGAPVLLLHSREAMSMISKPDWKSGGLAPSVGGDKSGAQGQQSEEPIGELPAAQRVNTKVLHYGPNDLTIQVFCPANGWLLVTDRWSAGWRARVNGRRTDVLGGNFIFRAVPVQAGSNEIKFSYDPMGWPVLLIVSWGTLIAVFTWPWITSVRKQ